MDLIEEKMKNFVRETFELILKDIETKFKDFDERLSSLEQEINDIKKQMKFSPSDKQIPDLRILESTKQEKTPQIIPSTQTKDILEAKEEINIIQSPKKSSDNKELLEALKVIDDL